MLLVEYLYVRDLYAVFSYNDHIRKVSPLEQFLLLWFVVFARSLALTQSQMFELKKIIHLLRYHIHTCAIGWFDLSDATVRSKPERNVDIDVILCL